MLPVGGGGAVQGGVGNARPRSTSSFWIARARFPCLRQDAQTFGKRDDLENRLSDDPIPTESPSERFDRSGDCFGTFHAPSPCQDGPPDPPAGSCTANHKKWEARAGPEGEKGGSLPYTRNHKKPHSPLSRRAAEILDAGRAPGDRSGLVFPMRSGRPISASTLPKMLQYHQTAAVARGFRSSFRDWVAEETDPPRKVIEAALAHVVQNKVEAAYARSDLFERRRRLVDAWATYFDR